MNRKFVSAVSFSMLLLLLMLAPKTGANPAVPNIMKLVYVTDSQAESIDPAFAYDQSCGQIICNIYDTLIGYQGELYDQFIPKLADQWLFTGPVHPEAPTGTVETWHFHIRDKNATGQDVTFHCSHKVTAADAEYSFERAMVQSYVNGPTWLLCEPLLDCSYPEDLGNIGNRTNPGPDVAVVGQMIDKAVESNDTWVWFNLKKPFAPFSQILSQTWASIVCKECFSAITQGNGGNGEWSGDWTLEYNETMPSGTEWIKHHNPAQFGDVPVDVAGHLEYGAGPYKLESWEPPGQTLVKYDDYWDGWPSKEPAPPSLPEASMDIGCKGFVEEVFIKVWDDWPTRLLDFQTGAYDIVVVPRSNYSQVDVLPGIRCIKPIPGLRLSPAMFFTYHLELGIQIELYANDTFGESGIPANFFSDNHTRRAFAHALDIPSHIAQYMLGEAVQPASPAIEGMPYHNPDQEKYTYNLTKAEEEFKLAFGGSLQSSGPVWQYGFTVYLFYNAGNLQRQDICWRIGNATQSLNPKFHCITKPMIYGIEYRPGMIAHQLPVFFIGWQADFAHPHNLFYPLMHSNGDYPTCQCYKNVYADKLIEEAVAATDPAVAQAKYYELQAIYHEDCPSVPITQPIYRHYERDWVQGYYPNQVCLGSYGFQDITCFYHMWKQEKYDGDVDSSGRVDMMDIGYICLGFMGKRYPPPIGPRWNFRLDVDYSQKIDLIDIGIACANYHKQKDPWPGPWP